jgi:hypothetical protein
LLPGNAIDIHFVGEPGTRPVAFTIGSGAHARILFRPARGVDGWG